MYETLKRLYLAETLTATMLDKAVTRGWITADQAAEIKAAKTSTTK